MVISTVNQVVYNGDGVTTAFPFTFRIIEATDIKLLLIDADGAETGISADYYVDTVNNTVYYPGYAPGAEPPAEDQPPKVQTGQKLVVYREIPITQEKDLGEKWPFAVIELALDKLTMILQQIFDWWGRTLKISQGGSVDGIDTNVYPEAGKVIAVNEDGDGFECREAVLKENNAWNGKGMQIKSVAEPTDNTDAATKNYVDSYADGNFMKLQTGGEAWEGRNFPIRNVSGPVQVNDAATKDYVDRILNGFVLAGDSRTVPVDTLEQLRTLDIEAGQIAFTMGYHDINDGGAGVYNIRAATVSDVDDGGSIIILDNGNVAELIVDNGKVNIRQFGAYGDNSHDDTDAIVACANYCSANNKILYSDKSHYKTTASCIISMVRQVELNGAFDYLELRYARTQANSSWQRIYRVENLLILRDYKYTYFQVGYAKEVQIIADYAFSSGSSFAYCAFYGGYYETLSLVGGAAGGWITDNSFFHVKLNTLNIGVGGSYGHNNNRFYDATLEGGTINFDHAHNNYISCRAEGGVTINKTSYSVNNIVERMYLARQGALRSAGWTFTGNNLYLNHFYKYLKRYEVLHIDINNLVWSENHDFANSIAYIKSWNSDGSSTALGNATFKFESDVVLCFYGNGQRASFVLLDANGDPVPKAVEDVVDTNNFSYNSTTHAYSMSTNIQDGSYGFNAYITYNSSTTIKYIQVRMSQGDASSKIISCGAFVLSGRNCAIAQKSKQRCVSKVKPIKTTSVPVSFEVINIGTDPTIEKWVYDGTAWQTVYWNAVTTPSAATAPTTGDHVAGEIVYNNAPTAGGTVGWVCVEAGTPGTWKAFGTIEA